MTVPARGRNSLRHGCGTKFDYNVARPITDEEVRHFHEKDQRTIAAEQRREREEPARQEAARRRADAEAAETSERNSLRSAGGGSSGWSQVTSAVNGAASYVDELWNKWAPSSPRPAPMPNRPRWR